MTRLNTIQRQIENYRTTNVPGARLMRQAAVAVIFRESSAGPEVLFIRRAEHPKDPWSGHMAFPGGKVDAEDANPHAAAVRETHEEVGLELARWATPFGRLSHVLAKSHGRMSPMIITPFVFALRETPQLVPDAREVQEVVWVPLAFLEDSENQTSFTRTWGGVPVRWSCYRYDERIIWGLTYQMLQDLLVCLKG